MIENRPRRLRKTAAIRRLVAETQLSVDDLVAPLFIREGINTPEPVHSLPGVFQHTRKSLLEEVKKLRDRGIPGLVLFGIPEKKDAKGSEALRVYSLRYLVDRVYMLRIAVYTI